MTIPFPHDSQLPQLQKLLDPFEMSRIMSNELGIDVLDCTPKYVRYKPNTSCIVQYDLVLDSESFEPTVLSAHIKVYADHRAQAKSTGSRAGRLDKRLENLQPDAPKVAYLPEVDGALQLFPADLDLRSLARIADVDGATKELKKALALTKSPTLAAEPELVRYKPGRKALFRYQVDSVSALPLYGKVFADESVVEMKAITDTLISAGLPTARVLGLVEQYNFIVHETAPGVALNEIRTSSRYLEWIQPLAEALWHLHSIEVPTLSSHSLANEVATLREIQTQLSTLLPHLAPRLEQIGTRLEHGFSRMEDIQVTSHGDFYDDQALVGESGLTLIDLEAMRLSHPLLDPGNMLAHLTAAARNSGDYVVAARQEFLSHTMKHHQVDEQTVNFFEAAGLLKLAPGPFRRLETDWNNGVERLLSLAEQALEPQQHDAVFDPALPQLVEILNVEKMSQPISQATNARYHSLEKAEVVRHKPGRRAITRFQFADAQNLYGKTFASKRGPKVFRVTEKIAKDRAFGPDVLTPDAIAYLPDHKLILLSEVPGNAIEERLCTGDTDLAERIAFALFHLHSSNVDLGRWHDLDMEISPLEGRCADIREHAPDLADIAEDLHLDIQYFGHQSMCWRLQPIHRDMYHDQIFIANDQLIVLDLDDAAMSEPAVDVANFATHIMLLGLQRADDPETYRPVIDAFLRQYAELDPDLDPGLVEFLTAATALRLAGIHVSRDNGVEIAKGLLVIAKTYLRDAWKSSA